MGRNTLRPIFGWTRVRWYLLVATLALMGALALPRIPMQRDVFDLLIVVDVTQSMNVLDYKFDGVPASRLAFVKQALREAVPQIPCGSKVGLGIFTEYRSFLLFAPVEVCANYRELMAVIGDLSGQMAWAGGSEIAKGLYSGLLSAKASEGAPALVFLTDGHEAPPINPHHRPEFTGRPGAVKGVIVGVGGLVPAPIPKFDLEGKPLGFWQPNEVMQIDPYSRGRPTSVAHEAMVDTEPLTSVPPALRITPGHEHLSSLHQDYLKLLAGETKLSFRRLTTTETLGPMLTQKALAREATVATDLRWIPALGALLLLVASYVPHWVRARRSSRGERSGKAAAVFLKDRGRCPRVSCRRESF